MLEAVAELWATVEQAIQLGSGEGEEAGKEAGEEAGEEAGAREGEEVEEFATAQTVAACGATDAG